MGHSQCRALGGNDGIPEGEYGTLLYGLQGEGFCDYVAYQARQQFPAPGEVDFRLYEDQAEVRRQVDAYNEVLAAVGSISPDELARLIWERCTLVAGPTTSPGCIAATQSSIGLAERR